MPAKNLVPFANLDKYGDSLHPSDSVPAYGEHGGRLVVPDDDAAALPGGFGAHNTTMPDRLKGANSTPNPSTPLDAMSIATKSTDAPPLGARQPKTMIKPDGWLDYDAPAYPKTKSGTE
jgi:hypothetical protein